MGESKSSTSKTVIWVALIGGIFALMGTIITVFGKPTLDYLPKNTPAPTQIILSSETSVVTFIPAPASGPTSTQKQETATLTQSIIDTGIIGKSVLDRNISFTRIGNGPQIVVIASALHGNEPNTAVLVDDLTNNFENTIEDIQNDFTIYLLPRLNPDGLYSGSRYNANNVDLNRNWNTNDWVKDAVGPSGIVNGSGSAAPFSEPETNAFSNLLLDLNQRSINPLIVFIYHAAFPPNGSIQPGYRLENLNQVLDTKASSLAETYASQVGYLYIPKWTSYRVTGEAIHWCADHTIICIDIELPNLNNLNTFEVQNHMLAIMKVIQK